jgi:hypothetical protein
MERMADCLSMTMASPHDSMRADRHGWCAVPVFVWLDPLSPDNLHVK